MRRLRGSVWVITETDDAYSMRATRDEFGEISSRYAGSFTVTESQIITLYNEEFYQDVHTEEFEDGEVRDQLTPTDQDVQLFDADLTGATTVLGHATGSLTDGELTVGGDFSGLRSRLENQMENVLAPAITIYTNGDNSSTYELIADIEDDEGSGQFAGSYELTDEEIEALRSGELTVEISTEDHPDGAATGEFVPR
ncbi:CHRD domain-containing protein [Natronorubrum daqingense]|uniref:CHRD domain-containing protein n=1 Tax=Natronorubrum daqingense TaxID=588898 RepID=A0A1N7C1V5_9EURY|nr:hypothetical protein BB347_08740 [Natronorubrum daqingense]SIR57433.1 CHRD domain-containing protein [Natronorubrum daqingense]